MTPAELIDDKTKILTTGDLKIAMARKANIEEFLRRRESGSSARKILRSMGENSSLLRHVKSWQESGGKLESLLPRHRNSGRPPNVLFAPTKEEIKAIRANRLQNNRDKNGGGIPQAIEQTIRKGKLRPELAQYFLARALNGQPMATPRLARKLYISPATTEAYRNPRNAWLNRVQSPGSLHLTRDADGTRWIQPGEQETIDDGTKNFICTVPMERPGDKCWQNFGVIVGRWQILLSVDHRTYFIQTFCHTARPKSSYRAEDILATWHVAWRQHGRPKKVILEKGISKAHLIHQALDLLGVQYEHVSSPHQKVVEFVFNQLWSRLSFLPGQVGRTRGEEAEVDALVESCKRGATDPRGYFLPLATVLKELAIVVNQWNSHLVNSRQYGKWVPREWYEAAAPKSRKPLGDSEDWMFSPTTSDPLKIQGEVLRTTYPVMPGYSWQFDFSAPWFYEFLGCRVRLHYNAFECECAAAVVLAQAANGLPEGTFLGRAEQINWQTRMARRAMGIDELDDIGLEKTHMNAQALYRSAIAVRPDGKPGIERHEIRDGTRGAGRPSFHGEQLPERKERSRIYVDAPPERPPSPRTKDSIAELFGV